jgi:peptidoglycan/LPS O-acetylase OafA/YrhL
MVSSASQNKILRQAAVQSTRFYLPRLDVMRFFSFLAVFVFHIAFMDGWIDFAAKGILPTLRTALFNSGRFGVDLFFTLSAYLITELLLREKDQSDSNSIDIKSFYIRRILRIWPLYFTALLATCAVTAIATRLGIFHFLPRIQFGCALSAALFVLNFALALNPLDVGGLITHLWSISVEEQFYLVWPLIMRRLSRRSLLPTGLLILALTNVLRITAIMHGARGPAIWFNTFYRLDPIAIGILVSACLNGRTDWPILSRLSSPLLVAGVLFWIAAGLCPLHNTEAGALATALAFPAAALGSGAFLLATIGAADSTSKVWKSDRFTRLGQISYGLYVFHYPIIGVLGIELKHIFSGWTLHLAVPLVGLGLTVICARVSFDKLERPFLRLKSHFQPVKTAGAY